MVYVPPPPNAISRLSVIFIGIVIDLRVFVLFCFVFRVYVIEWDQRSSSTIHCIMLLTTLPPGGLSALLLRDLVSLLGTTIDGGEPGKRSRYRDWLRAGRAGDRIPVRGEIFRTLPDRL